MSLPKTPTTIKAEMLRAFAAEQALSARIAALEAAVVPVVPTTVPAAPSDLTATSGDGIVTLTWTTPATATTNYVYRDGVLIATVT